MKKKVILIAKNFQNNRLKLYILLVVMALSFNPAMSFVLAGNIKDTSNPSRTITFAGYEWTVKTSAGLKSGTMGPGNNYFSDSRNNVWVDNNGWLHLKITQKKGNWYCAEVILTKSLGYKKYIFQVTGRVDQFQKNVVGGLFTYLDQTDNKEEIDIEFSKWNGISEENPALFGIQPTDSIGNMKRFNLNLTGDNTTHVFDWKPGKVDFVSYHGHYSTPPDSTFIINSWSYSGKDVPFNPDSKVHINLWLFNRQVIDPAEEIDAEMVIKDFQVL